MESNIQPTSVINLMPSNQEEMDLFVQKVEENIANVDPLRLKLQIKMMEKLIEKLNESEAINNSSLSEAYKYGAKSFKAYGAEFNVRNNTKYDYSVCKDNDWNFHTAKLKKHKAALKAREDYLKTIKEKVVELDEETGQFIEIYPAACTKKEIVAITIK